MNTFSLPGATARTDLASPNERLAFQLHQSDQRNPRLSFWQFLPKLRNWLSLEWREANRPPQTSTNNNSPPLYSTPYTSPADTSASVSDLMGFPSTSSDESNVSVGRSTVEMYYANGNFDSRYSDYGPFDD